MTFKKICLVGANGGLGSAILKELVSGKAAFEHITLLQRESSSSTPQIPKPHDSSSPTVTTTTVPDAFPVDALTTALQGYDALVIAIRTNDVEQHRRLLQAAANAGVRRVLPADFGSADSYSERAQASLKLYRDKKAIYDECARLSSQVPGFEYTGIVCGHFFDEALLNGFLHFDLAKHHADLHDGGEVRFSVSTLAQTARAARAVLQGDDTGATANKIFFIQSFNVTQKQILTSFEKATKTAWTTKELDGEAFLKEQVQKANDGDKTAKEEVVFVLGISEGDWRGRGVDGMMKEMGLMEETLDEEVVKVLEEFERERARG